MSNFVNGHFCDLLFKFNFNLFRKGNVNQVKTYQQLPACVCLKGQYKRFYKHLLWIQFIWHVVIILNLFSSIIPHLSSSLDEDVDFKICFNINKWSEQFAILNSFLAFWYQNMIKIWISAHLDYALMSTFCLVLQGLVKERFKRVFLQLQQGAEVEWSRFWCNLAYSGHWVWQEEWKCRQAMCETAWGSVHLSAGLLYPEGGRHRDCLFAHLCSSPAGLIRFSLFEHNVVPRWSKHR